MGRERIIKYRYRDKILHPVVSLVFVASRNNRSHSWKVRHPFYKSYDDSVLLNVDFKAERAD